MNRPRIALGAIAAAGLLAGCGTGGDATQSDVQNEVQELLVEEGFAGGEPLPAAEAEAVGECVARGMFESGDFTPEERNDIVNPGSGEPPPEQLVAKTTALVEGCVENPSGEGQTAGPEAPTDD